MPPPQGSWNPIEGPGDFTTTKEVHNDTYPGIDPTKAELAGYAVFIAGASRGIGKAIAISYAKAGASQIAIAARSDLSSVADELRAAAKEAGKSEPQVLVIKMDITDASSVEAAAKQIEEAFSKLDIVINNAGIFGERKPIAETDPAGWWSMWEVNVKGPYLISRFCIPLLLKGEMKTLATVSSVGAHIVTPGVSSYQSGKLAVTRLMQFASVEYGEQGLIAFSVHPGNILTDIVQGVSEELKKIFTETPQLCADTLVYLTKERREWLGGRYVNCTWDMPELTSSPKKDEIIEKDLLKSKLAV